MFVHIKEVTFKYELNQYNCHSFRQQILYGGFLFSLNFNNEEMSLSQCQVLKKRRLL